MRISSSIIAGQGFRVIAHDAVETALSYLESSSEFIDLFVLDRRLPMRIGEQAADELGDALLSEVRSSYPDARVIVFTGYTSDGLFQDAMKGSGQFPIRSYKPVDRISVLRKDQSIEFRRLIAEFGELLQELDDIEISEDTNKRDISISDQRLLRRVAYEFNAVSLRPTSLTGGLTGAQVWGCEIHQDQGHVANVVAKRAEKLPSLAGLQDLLPLSTAATTRASVAGLIGGGHVSILRLAGDNARSLSRHMAEDIESSSDYVAQVSEALDRVQERAETVTLETLISPLLTWEKFDDLLRSYEIPRPSPNMRISTRIGMRHGDLHVANVMIAGGEAVLIDFDSNCFGSALLDPVTLFLSTLVHPDSPLRGASWPDASEIDANLGTGGFGVDHAGSQFFAATQQWINARISNEREFWGIVLGFCARQLRYPDVVADTGILERTLVIVRKASTVLRNS